MGSYYLFSSIAVFLFMTGLFILAQFKKDNSIVDIGWGIGFVIIAFVSFFLEPGYHARELLILTLVTLWGIRLAGHLWSRAIGRSEDFRYANFRKQWGDKAVMIAFFRVFMMQGAIMLLLAYPIILVHAAENTKLGLLAIIGTAVWIVGFIFETVGDYQLERFKKTKTHKEQVLNTGLWRYTRHPNYFGEATMWWGIFLIVLPVPNGWTAFFSALLINFLLLKISGVPFLEKRYAENAAYQQYKQETNRFIPWFPKKKSQVLSSQ